MPTFPQPPGADSLQPPNSPPDSGAAMLQVSGAVVGWGHTLMGAGCPWPSVYTTASPKGISACSLLVGRVEGVRSTCCCCTGGAWRTVEGPGRPGACSGQLPAGCGGCPRNAAPGRSPISCWGCIVPATGGCSQQWAGALGGGIPGFMPPGRSMSRGNCRPPGWR